MANATNELIITAFGPEGVIMDLPVDGGSTIYKGTLCTQLTATGMLVPYSTASAGSVVGVAQNGADNASGSDGNVRARVETKRVFAFANGGGGDAFSEASLIGALVYGTDDHTVADNSNSLARKPVGFFMGMEDGGKVRVYVDPCMAEIVRLLQTLTDAPATADALRDNLVGIFG